MNLEEYLRQIKDQLDIVDYIGKQVPLRKAGRNWVGLCPFHAEKTPSFSVNGEKEIFYCFGCHVGGDLIAFVQQFDHLDFREAVDLLGEKAGLAPMTWGDRSPASTNTKEEAQKILVFARTYYQNQFDQNIHAQEYLKQRDISKDTWKAFQLGYASAHDPEFFKQLREQHFDLDLCGHLGLIVKDAQGNMHPYFRERLLFPICDVHGRLLGFGGRAIREGVQPKYLNSPEHSFFHKGKHLYALNLAKASLRSEEHLIIVEGYMDVVSLYQHGVYNVCASLGTAFTQDQAKLAYKYSQQLLFCHDNDHAGMQSSVRAVELLFSMQKVCKVLRLPLGCKDPDDYIRQRGKEAWKKLCDEAMMPWDFLWKTLWSDTKQKDPLAVEMAIRKMLEKISQYPDIIQLELLLKSIALDTGTSMKILDDRLQRFQKGASKPKGSTHIRTLRTGNIPSKDGEKILLKSLMEKANPSFQSMIIDKISVEDFSVEIHKKLYAFLKEEFKKNGYLVDRDIISRISEDDLKRLVSELFLIEEGFYNDTAVLECVLKTEENKNRNQAILHLTEQIIQAEKDGDITLSKQLREELKRVV
jgi:DNA primase